MTRRRGPLFGHFALASWFVWWIGGGMPTHADESSSELQWSITAADCNYRVLTHRIVESDPELADSALLATLHKPPRDGSHADLDGASPTDAGLDDLPPERIEVKAGHGTHIYAVHPIAPARVADEFSIRVVVWADRPGVQLLTRVVLPRSLDPVTKKPFTVLVPGEMYRHAGTWQVLGTKNVTTQLEERIRVLRSQVDTPIDAREAYVDVVVLNIYGGAGITTTSIQSLHVDRLLDSPESSHGQLISITSAGLPSEGGSGVREKGVCVSLEGDILQTDGRPLFVRMVDDNGEPFEFLQELGFNTIHLARSPSRQQLVDAERLGLWLVCPPPDQNATLYVGVGFQRVLAWELGGPLGRRELRRTEDMVTAIRDMALLAERPVMGTVDDALPEYSRCLDILEHRRDVLGTSFPLADYGQWFHEQCHLAAPGCAHWATIQTEAISLLTRQNDRFLLKWHDDLAVDDGLVEVEQVRSMALLAVMHGARGLHFRSRSRLDAETASALQRSQTLKLLNLELDQINPWAAGGRADEVVVDQADPTVRVATVRTPRSSLVLVSRHTDSDQYVSSSSGSVPLQVLIPCSAVAAQVFELTASGPRPCAYRRVVGGLRVEIQPFCNDTLIVVTQDPIAMERLSRDSAERVKQVATLRHYVMAHEMEQAAMVIDELRTQRCVCADTLHQIEQRRQQADGAIRRSALLIHDKDFVTAEHVTREATAYTAECRRAVWRAVTDTMPICSASPLACRFANLPRQTRLSFLMSRVHAAPNALPGGDCEDLSVLVDQGWQCRQHSQADLNAEVRVDREEAFRGESSLLLRTSCAAQSIPATVPAVPLWINSSPVPVKAGQLVMVHGWANVPRRLAGNLDGLMIFDSIGGPELGVRLRETDGWQEFQLYRVVEADQELTVTFAMPGIGEARLDELSVRALQ